MKIKWTTVLLKMFVSETIETIEFLDEIIHMVNAVVDYLKGAISWEINYQEKYNTLIKTVPCLHIVPCQYFIYNGLTYTSYFCDYESSHSIPTDNLQSREGRVKKREET